MMRAITPSLILTAVLAGICHVRKDTSWNFEKSASAFPYFICQVAALSSGPLL